jgi:hypothetical protein
MIRIAISLAAYQALAATKPEGTARPPEPLKVGEGVGSQHPCSLEGGA